jgi:hypothetical protein
MAALQRIKVSDHFTTASDEEGMAIHIGRR